MLSWRFPISKYSRTSLYIAGHLPHLGTLSNQAIKQPSHHIHHTFQHFQHIFRQSDVAPLASKAISPKSQETLNNTAPTFLSWTFPALRGLSKDSGGRARQLAGQLMRTWNQATPTVIKTLSELGQELAPNGSCVVVWQTRRSIRN